MNQSRSRYIIKATGKQETLCYLNFILGHKDPTINGGIVSKGSHLMDSKGQLTLEEASLNSNGLSSSYTSNVKWNDRDIESRINRFGYGRFTPNWLQFFNHQHWLLFFLCTFILTAGMQATGFTGVVITSLEKRYELRSTETAFIASVYEISAAIVGTIAGFYACQGHKPRFLAYGAVTMSLGAFIFALPHFISGEYYSKTSSEYTGLCYPSDINNLTTKSPLTPSTNTPIDLLCDETSILRNFIYVILIGQILVGAGNNLLWNVGMACMDENVSPNVSSIYMAIMMSLSALGPAVGFLLGGAFMRVYVDWPMQSPGKLSNTLITKKSRLIKLACVIPKWNKS